MKKIPDDHDYPVIRDTGNKQEPSEETGFHRLLLDDTQSMAHVGSWDFYVASGRGYWTDEMCRIFGYPPEMTQPGFEAFLRRVHPDDVAKVLEFKDSYAPCLEPRQFEFRICRPDGAERYVLCRMRAQHDSGGVLERVFGTVQDITERKRIEDEMLSSRDKLEKAVRDRTAALNTANQMLYSELAQRTRTEAALREREGQLRRVLDSMQDAFFRTDLEGRLIMVNPAAARLYGYGDTGEMTGIFATALYADEAERNAVMREIETSGSVQHRIGRGRKKDGSLFWVSLNAQYYQDEQGNVLGTEGFARDITRRMETEESLREREKEIRTLFRESEEGRRALLNILEDVRLKEKALIESENLFSSVLETASDGIIAVDGSGAIVLWNRAAEKMFGYTKQEAVGMHFVELLPEKVRDTHNRAFENTIESGEAPVFTFALPGPGLRKDGTEFMAETTVGIVQKEDDILVTLTFRDITERIRIEQEAMRSAQLASVGELAAGVAHEINNPIMGVINYAQIIRNRSRDAGDLPERIIREGERIAKIVTNLLTFARESTEVMVPAQVQPVMQAAFALMEKLFLQSGVIANIDLPPDLPRAVMQPPKIQQVFINILSNALYALNQKYPGLHPDKICDITGETVASDEGALVRIVFCDRGCGMHEHVMAKVCNPFFTTKPVGKGTGLGLSISHNIIKEHKGRLLFESRSGEYTRVIVELPAEIEN